MVNYLLVEIYAYSCLGRTDCCIRGARNRLLCGTSLGELSTLSTLTRVSLLDPRVK
jgi:hypothetical protein